MEYNVIVKPRMNLLSLSYLAIYLSRFIYIDEAGEQGEHSALGLNDELLLL